VLCLKYNSGWTPFTENKLLWASVWEALIKEQKS
jgi:hypothetical protein